MTSKMDALALEFNRLLVSQLDSQRHYYEGRLHDLVFVGHHHMPVMCPAQLP